MAVVLLFSKSSPPDYLGELDALFPGAKHMDYLEAPISTDLIVHIETPVYGWMPWATANIFIMNPDTYTTEWDPYLTKFTNIFKVKELPHSFTVTETERPVPILKEYPPISIVTLMYNRPKFFDLACYNLMTADYPLNKIEWIIVDDSSPELSCAADIEATAAKSNTLKIVYLPVAKSTIATKRNLGVQAASNEIVAMMDDDDHYPASSLAKRVAWFSHPWQPKATVATTIACYDLMKGISAVNVPPFTLSLGKRVSEATLTFKKSWWLERPFSDVQIGEGEEFIKGRELDVLEIPPQQIIVAFRHGDNVSSRRVPDTTPGCFWGFPKEFLVFVHGLVGVSLEEIA
jgi:hypothetical protein